MLEKVLHKYTSLGITAKATLWFVFCNFVQKAISIITTPLFTRLLTTEQYGEYTMYMSWLQIFTLITTLKIYGGGFNKAMSKYPERRDEYVSTMQLITTFLTIVVFSIYLLFKNPINALTEMGTLVMCAMFVELVFSPAITFWTIRQRYEYKYQSVVFITVLVAVCNALLGLVAVLLTTGPKGTARILSCVVVQVVIGGIIYVRNFTVTKKHFSWDLAKYGLSFSIVLVPHYLAMNILEQSDRMMIQKICGTSYAGIYGVAYSAGLLLKMVTESITNALIPWMYDKLEKKDVISIRKKFIPLFYAVLFMLTLFIAFAPDIVMILAGSKYREAAYVIPPVTASIFFIFIYTIFANTEFFYEAKSFTMYISIGGAVLNLILNYIAIPMFGFVAAGYTTLICYAALAFGHFMYSQHLTVKNTNEKLFEFTTVLFPSFIMVTLCVLMSLLYGHLVIRYVFIALILIVIMMKRKYIESLLRELKK